MNDKRPGSIQIRALMLKRKTEHANAQLDVMIRAGEKVLNNAAFSSTKGLRTGFAKDVLTKKETVFRLSLWWARRDLNPHVRNEH